MNNLKVLAVVVTYNRKELLVECLDKLSKQSVPCDVLVVDNASTDGTSDAISSFVKQGVVDYVNTGSNLGGAGGFNFALKAGVSSNKYDYIWLMDDDTMAHSDSLEKLLDAAEKLNKDFGFLASYVQFTNGEVCEMNVPTIASKKWIYGFNYSTDLIGIQRATFVSLLIPTKVVLMKGLPIKEFFIWSDDSEYTKRISKDIPSYLVTSSVVTHKMLTNAGVTANGIISEESERIGRYYYAYRNRFFIAKREGIVSVLKYLIKTFGTVLLVLLKAKKYKIKKISTILKGFCHGIVFNPKIEYIEK